MTAQRTQGYPVLIVGAGRGGTALLEMFVADNLVEVVAIADTDAEAPGIKLAKQHGIPTFTDAVRRCKPARNTAIASCTTCRTTTALPKQHKRCLEINA